MSAISRAVGLAVGRAVGRATALPFINGTVLSFSGAVMDSATGEMLLQDVGTGTPTSTHTATHYQIDLEDRYVPHAANVPVWLGGRQVTNQLAPSEDLTQLGSSGSNITAYAKYVDITANSNNAYRTFGTGVTATLQRNKILSFKITDDGTATGTVGVRLHDGSNTVNEIISIDLSAITGSKRFAIAASFPSGLSGNINFTIEGRSALGGDGSVTGTVYIGELQLEDVTGRSDLVTPSEYVATTTTAVTKTFGTENGNSVASNVVTEAKGADLAQLPWLWWQPLATNLPTYSRDLSNAAWSSIGSIAASKNAVGIDGAPNAASTVTDSDAAAASYKRQEATIADSSNPVSVIFRVLKTLAAATFPALQFQIRGGTAISASAVILNTDTGALGVVAGGATWEVVSDGDWWKVLGQETNNGSGNTVNRFQIYPAFSDDGTTSDVTLQGSCVVDCIELHDNKTIAEVRNLGPIFTTTAADSTDALAPAWDGANIDDTNGGLYCEWYAPIADTEAAANLEILSTTTGASLLYYDATANVFKSTDGTNTVSAGGAIVAGTAYKLGVVWDANAGTMRLSVGGVWGTEGTYDGVFTGADLIAGRASLYGAGIRNIQGWSGSYAALQAKIEELMAA